MNLNCCRKIKFGFFVKATKSTPPTIYYNDTIESEGAIRFTTFHELKHYVFEDDDEEDGGQTYHSLGEIDGVKVIVRDKGSVKAPEFSHTANRIYAVVQDGKLKHLTFYGEDHKQAVSIDLLHPHHGLMPHKHLNLDHSDSGIPLSAEEEKLVKK